MKIKNTESDLHKFQNIIDPTSSSIFEVTSGGIDGRSNSISKMTEKLGKLLEKQKSQEIENQGRTQEMEIHESKSQEPKYKKQKAQELKNQGPNSQETLTQEQKTLDQKNHEKKSLDKKKKQN